MFFFVSFQKEYIQWLRRDGETTFHLMSLTFTLHCLLYNTYKLTAISTAQSFLSGYNSSCELRGDDRHNPALYNIICHPSVSLSVVVMHWE